MNSLPPANRTSRQSSVRPAFTLVELLTVIAIISLLIAILIPSLSGARRSAQSLKTRTILKGLGDGLELFRGENEDECRLTRGYPPSAAADDPTEQGTQHIFGAQWLVRYLAGKDLKGYVAKRNVPADLLSNPQTGWEQKEWYDPDRAVPRVGPYVELGQLRIIKPSELRGVPSELPANCNATTLEQLVVVDTFSYPILYYAANAFVAARQNAPLARFDARNPATAPEPAIYTFSDNGLFTGMALTPSQAPVIKPWDFLETGPDTYYPGSRFGPAELMRRDQVLSMIQNGDTDNFVYRILNKGAFEASQRNTATPYNPNTYLLISPGADGKFGTADDIKNFD